MNLDEDAVVAGADLVGRTGATHFQVGYVNDDPPHLWYAQAQYRGARITEENHPGPVEAVEALARRLLTGGKCVNCGKLIALSGSGAFAYTSPVMADGSTWTAEEAAAAGQCRWTRMGRRWGSACKREGWGVVRAVH
jgi:hypothetical protein